MPRLITAIVAAALALALLEIRDRLGCPSVDTPACPRISMLLGAGVPAWLPAVPAAAEEASQAQAEQAYQRGAKALDERQWEKDPALRGEAARQLGLMGAEAQLWEIYQAEADPAVKKDILQALFLGGKGEKLVEVARTDRDAKLRLAAIRNLGLAGKRWGEQLVSIYDADQDKSIRTAVIHALFLQSNVQPLIAIARKEANPELKREAVQKLSLMRSKEATEFMMELLNK